MQDNRNLILAIVLSLIVIVGWQFLVIGPQMEAEQKRRQIEEQAKAGKAGETGKAGEIGKPGGAASHAPSAPAGTAAGGSTTTAAPAGETATKAPEKRIPLDTPKVNGTFNLTGARIDDLKLKDYHETVDRKSPEIRLLSPSGSEHPYFAEFGWVAGGDAPPKLPGPDTPWTLVSGDRLAVDSPVTLSWDNGEGLVFRRTVAIDDKYMFTVSDTVENKSGKQVSLFPYGLVSRQGTPETSSIYILHTGLIGKLKRADEDKDDYHEVDYSDLKEEGTVDSPKASKGWLGITDKYWGVALVPASKGDFKPQFKYRKSGDKDLYQANFLADGINIPAGGSGAWTTKLFAGAKVVSIVNSYEEDGSAYGFSLMIDWGWFHFITRPMFWLLDWFFQLIGNFGLAILAVTVVVKLVFFPLANKSYASMSRMKLVQPQLTELRERFKDDKAAQQKAMMELYKKEKINPLAGCLPILLQIPVFFSLYKVLYVTIEMRHAPFFGWIKDLAAPDPTTVFNLFGLIPWDPPQILMLGVWPLIMGITMFLQMRLNPQPPDKTQAMIFTWMPVMFTFMLASFPAGLVIYWAWNNSLSIAQQAFIMHRQGARIEIWKNTLETLGLRKSKEKAS